MVLQRSSDQAQQTTLDTISYKTIVGALQAHALAKPDEVAVIFLEDGESTEKRLTFSELMARANGLASELMQRGMEGERVLLLQPTGLEYVISFMGCLLAGALAVPLYPPRNRDRSGRLDGVIKDCRPLLALTSSDTQARGESGLERVQQISRFELLNVQTISPAQSFNLSKGPHPDNLAFLQYTSGSTTTPKGVMVSHANIAANEETIRLACSNDATTVVVSWLPLHHDMGLIGGLLQGIWLGRPVVLLKPDHFLGRPARWIEAIDRYRATISAAPNFAYELCVSSMSAAEISRLTLNSWRIATNGAEPIRSSTLSSFAKKFASAGFHASSFLPCYGLAESTLFVSGERRSQQYHTRPFGLNGSEVVSCGLPGRGGQIAIVNPITLSEAMIGTEGEIWVSGPQVAVGYWANPAASEETFAAVLRDREGCWLRTGDLGFVWEDELFVTGRSKDMIVYQGVNYYPQDIEGLLAEVLPSLAGRPSAAFSAVEGADCGSVVVVQEVRRRTVDDTALRELGPRLRDALAEAYGLELATLVAIPAGSMPVTTSGKVRRSECRRLYDNGDLPLVASWSQAKSSHTMARVGQVEARAWFRSELAQVLDLEPARIHDDDEVLALGLDSITAVVLRNAAEVRYSVTIPLSSILGKTTVASLAAELVQLSSIPSPRSSQATVENLRAAEGELSSGQKSLWFVNQLDPGSSAYNLQFAAKLVSNLNEVAFRHALVAIVDRHEQLHSRFAADEWGTPRRYVLSRVDTVETAVAFYSRDVSGLDEPVLHEQMTQDSRRPFNLDRAPLLRVFFYKGATSGDYLLLSAHHIVADITSLAVIVSELAEAYTSILAGSEPAIPDAPSSYSAFIAQQASWLESDIGRSALTWWKSSLKGAPQALNLPLDFSRPARQSYRGNSVNFLIDEGISADLRLLARDEGVTLNALLLTSYVALLHLISGQNDLVVGTPASGRTSQAFEQTVGYFVNPLALRIRLNSATSTRALLLQVRDQLVDGLTRQDVPFGVIVDQVLENRDASRSPLFQAMFTMERSHKQAEVADFIFGLHRTQLRLGSLTFESVPLAQQEGQFELDLSVVDTGGALSGSLQFNTDLFDSATIERWKEFYMKILVSVVVDVNAKVGELLGQNDDRDLSIIGRVHASCSASPPLLPIGQRISDAVAATPDGIALVSGDRTLTYKELNSRAERLASDLLRRGARAETRVAVVVDRGELAVIALLAVWKAGAAFVPIDISYPSNRIEKLIVDSGAQLIVASMNGRHLLPLGIAEDVIVLEPNPEVRENEVYAACQPSTNADERAAYIVYTSGSTGHPKGVIISQHALASSYYGWSVVYGLDRPRTVLQLASVAFDVFIGNVIRALTTGGRLILAERADILDPERLYRIIHSEGVDFVEFVPAIFRAFMDHVSRSQLPLVGLRTVLVGSDVWLRHEYNASLRSLPAGARLLGSYGASEATIDNLTFDGTTVSPESSPVPLGRPFYGCSVYLLSAELRAVPVGSIGELFIAGDVLARGYIGMPGFTAERFLPDPFGKPGTRMYRTGDLARVGNGRSIDFLGRSDHQIKMHGQRIEPGEVEKAILDAGSVSQALVTIAGERERQVLIAYVAPIVDDAVIATIRRRLSERLPSYMVPSRFIATSAFPLTSNGKVDRASLSFAVACDSPDKDGYPRTETEAELERIFAEVLSLEQVGREESFFEIGGDSIMSMQVVSRARRVGISLSATDIYEFQSIALIAQHATRVDRKSIIETPIGAVPLTEIQRWFFSRSFAEPNHWNQAVLLEADAGNLDVKRLEEALGVVIAHHDAFRLRYSRDAGDWTQTYAQDSAWEGLHVISGNDLLASEPVSVFDAYQQSLRLREGPLTRTVAIINKERVLVLWIAHHLIVDGVSWRILLEDLMTVYEAPTAANEVSLANSLSFQKWACRVPKSPDSRDLSASLQTSPTQMSLLPRDHVLGPNNEGSVSVVSLQLDEKSTQRLTGSANRAYSTRVDDILLLAAAQAASRCWNRHIDEFSIDLEGHGRVGDDSYDPSRTIGWFTNVRTIALASSGVSITEQIVSVKETVRNAERGTLQPLDSSPRADMSLNYLGNLTNVLPRTCVFHLSKASCGALRSASAVRDYALEIDCKIVEDRFAAHIAFSRNLHSLRTITTFARHFRSAIETVVAALCNGAPEDAPSDFAETGLNQRELRDLLQRIGLPQ